MAAGSWTPRWLPAKLLLLWMLTNLCESGILLSAPDVVTLEESSQASVNIASSGPFNQSTLLWFNVTFSSKSNYTSIITLPEQILFQANATSSRFNVTSHNVGQVTTHLRSNSTDMDSLSTRIRFSVVHSNVVSIISQVIGWLYFVAWSISFYPQAWQNWKTKSVVGLNFDFLALNLTGFIAYSVFNIGLFWIPYIKELYLEKNPEGINPVSANDVFFSLHAVLLCLIYVFQAASYERGGQRLSLAASAFLIMGWTFATISLCLAVANQITWLDYLYNFSYIKLAVTLIKYVPQAYMNYRRQSTSGWSIGNVLLDFSGGTLSILQMILDSYNNDQWSLIFGDPTKFGLGLFSVVFDILFMVQHYCLYKPTFPYEQITEQQE